MITMQITMPPMKPAFAIAKGTAMTAEGAAKVKSTIPACLKMSVGFGASGIGSRVFGLELRV